MPFPHECLYLFSTRRDYLPAFCAAVRHTLKTPCRIPPSVPLDTPSDGSLASRSIACNLSQLPKHHPPPQALFRQIYHESRKKRPPLSHRHLHALVFEFAC